MPRTHSLSVSNTVDCHRSGAINALYVALLAALALMLVAVAGLWQLSRPAASISENSLAAGGTRDSLFLYCAAGIRPAIESATQQYRDEFGIDVQIQYGGSNSLLSQLEVSRIGDVYLAADDSYTRLAQERGLVRETIPLAWMKPVVAVARGNPKAINSIEDLLRTDVTAALGNPDQAAIGKVTRSVLTESGHWNRLHAHVTATGVFKPTVPDVANDVKIGAVDAGIVWDITAFQYSELDAVATPELDRGQSSVEIGILESATNPTRALHFCRYLAACDRGLMTFAANGFQVVDGDVWSDRPEITFFCGSVNRRAVEPVIDAFQRREGGTVNTVYNGCGILTAQMRTIMDGTQASGFPDCYMACDVYYLTAVEELFQDAVNVSETDIVIVVQKGNPKNIQNLKDLTRDGISIAIGQPDQCTIGVLSRELLESEGLLADVKRNVATETATSALLVPNVTTGAVDAVLAYVTDTLSERGKVDVIPIDSSASQAVQPFSIARSSEHKFLSRRLLQAIARSRDSFESAGFRWKLELPAGIGSLPESVPHDSTPHASGTDTPGTGTSRVADGVVPAGTSAGDDTLNATVPDGGAAE